MVRPAFQVLVESVPVPVPASKLLATVSESVPALLLLTSELEPAPESIPSAWMLESMLASILLKIV